MRQSLKSSSLFGESLRVSSKSTLKFSRAKSTSVITKCEIGDSLVSYLHVWSMSFELIY